jgi:hypothetical protein
MVNKHKIRLSSEQYASLPKNGMAGFQRLVACGIISKSAIPCINSSERHSMLGNRRRSSVGFDSLAQSVIP